MAQDLEQVGSSNPQDASDSGAYFSGDMIVQSPASYKELATWCLTGMSGWWSLNAIIAELPHFVAVLPEGPTMGNLIAVCTQLGNIAPITYKAIYRHNNGRLTHVIATFQGLAALTLITCAVSWDSVTGGHSMVLLLCTALAGCVGCMSNVTYWAVAAGRPPSCTKAMSVGMTIGGLISIALAALQMAGRGKDDLRFSPRTFFAIAAAVQVVQGIAFLVQMFTATQQSDSRRPSASPSLASVFSQDTQRGSPEDPLAERKVVLPFAAKVLLFGVFFLYAATYTMPSLQPFIATSYPDASQQQQLLLFMLVLQNLGDVVGRVSTAWTHGKVCAAVVFSLALFAAFMAAVIFAVDRKLASSLWSYETALWVLPAICGVYYFTRGHLVTKLYLHARTLGDTGFATKLSLHMGFWGQMGALVATALTFVLVTAFHVLGH